MKSQNKAILKHLQKGLSITPLLALRMYGCLRLGARIYDLKQQGHSIDTTIVKPNGKRVASYSIK